MVDHNSGSLQMGETSPEQMRGLMREMADFIALYETMEEKLVAREVALEGRLLEGERIITDQLARVKASFVDFQAIMTEAGAARWRIAAENALREGKQHLQTLQQTSLEVTHTLKDGCSQLEAAATQTIANVADAISSFQALGFKESAAKNCDQVKKISVTGIKRITRAIKSFHWKNFAISVIITLFIVFLSGLYINDEWPWEIHARAAKERSAGATLLAAWGNLSPSQQQEILIASKKAP